MLITSVSSIVLPGLAQCLAQSGHEIDIYWRNKGRKEIKKPEREQGNRERMYK